MKRLHRHAHNEVCRALDVGVNFRTTLLFENSLRDGPVWVAFLAHRNMNGPLLHTAAYVMPVSIMQSTCARLCHGAGGELEQIQFFLGHASVQTTERYIRCRQNFREAVNDRFQISLANHAP